MIYFFISSIFFWICKSDNMYKALVDNFKNVILILNFIIFSSVIVVLNEF